MANSYLWGSNFFSVQARAKSFSLYSKVAKAPKIHIKFVILLFSLLLSITCKKLNICLKPSKISRDLLLKYSQDPSVSCCVPKLQAGNWQGEEAVQASETDLRHKSITGHHQHSCHGLGYIKSSRDYRTFISSRHKEIDVTYAISKTVQLKVQGQWSRWLNYIQQNFSWE